MKMQKKGNKFKKKQNANKKYKIVHIQEFQQEMWLFQNECG